MPDWVIEIIKTGGPAGMAVLCFFLYIRESGKRDEAQAKYETLIKETSKGNIELTERVVEALNNADHAIVSATSTIEGVRTSLNLLITFIHSYRDDKG